MASGILQSLSRACGTTNFPGLQLKAYFTFVDELTGFPQTAEDLGGTDQGDSKVLNEPFDFSGAPVGEGYWRYVDLVVNRNQWASVLEGEPGGQSFKNNLDFYIKGAAAAQLEFADQMLANSGCYIWMIADKQEVYYVFGTPTNPVFVETVEGGSGQAAGDPRGFKYSLMTMTGWTPSIYDAATHGIDETPN